jgi:type II secretion system (T2SS) protein E
MRLEFGNGLRARLEGDVMPDGTTAVLEPEDEAASLIALLPAQTAYLFRVLPIGFVDERPLVAVVDPKDELGMACVRRALGEDVEFVPAPEEDVLTGLMRAYGHAA